MKRSDGTLQVERERLPWPDGKPFRILSIDGGGIRGILPAAVLAQLEDRYTGGRSIGDYFDLIAGTSTGGIISLGLSMGKRASQILDLYKNWGGEVFPKPSRDPLRMLRAWRFLRSIRHYTYNPKVLEQQLTATFGDALLGEATRRLCVPSFDGRTEVYIFKTPHHRDYRSDWRERAVTVALATSAAPTYFPIHQDGERYFGDGGVWANNPIMIALVDALACYEIQRRQVDILSIGTGDTEIRVTKKQIALGGLWHWREVVSSAMHLQSQNALGQAGLLIGRDKIMRLNAPPMPTKPIALDDYARAKAELPFLATELVEANGDEIARRFLSQPAEEYSAFYGPRSVKPKMQ